MLRLEVRPQPSKGWGYASPLLALAITVVIGITVGALYGSAALVVGSESLG